jgi:hypothetical protein
MRASLSDGNFGSGTRIVQLLISNRDQLGAVAAGTRRQQPEASSRRRWPPCGGPFGEFGQAPVQGRPRLGGAQSGCTIRVPGVLLTLTGTGGVGKTRLALQVVDQVGDERVWFIDLARWPTAYTTMVAPASAAVLGVREESTRPLVETLADVLGLSSGLLVLDNCEHVLEACAMLPDRLLRANLDLRILATSREAFRIAGETVWRVPSLAVPGRSRARRYMALLVEAFTRSRTSSTSAAALAAVSDRRATLAVSCKQLPRQPPTLPHRTLRLEHRCRRCARSRGQCGDGRCSAACITFTSEQPDYCRLLHSDRVDQAGTRGKSAGPTVTGRRSARKTPPPTPGAWPVSRWWASVAARGMQGA